MRDRDRMWSLSQELMLICTFDGIITAVNPASVLLLGWTEEEMVGKTIVDFLHPDDIQSTAAEVANLSDGTPTMAFENRYRTKKGEYRVLNWTAVPDQGRIHALARDITRERLAEDSLRQAQKMEALGQLTGGIAHDFNNMLQGIMGNAAVVKKLIGANRVNEAEPFIDRAINSTKRAAALTHRLLAYSRRQPLEPRALELNPLIGSMEDLLRRTLGEHVHLKLALAHDLWWTKCDPNQLENALLNLAINARDAMADGGILTIETCNTVLDDSVRYTIDDVRPGRYVCIAVTDNGTGMTSDTVAKAFEPFFTTKPIGQGTGLGLSMIYGFARQSDGYAKIYSEEGKGTTVKLYLPQVAGAGLPDEHERSGLERRAVSVSGTIAVVEDEAMVRELIVEALQDAGFKVREACDGTAGLKLMESADHIDLLLTDVGLPGLNGRQLADDCRAQRPEMKILFMTGYAPNAVFSSGMLDTGMTMITKPFAIDALVSKVRDLMVTK